MNNIKYYFRSIIKERFTSIISIIGISIGFASCMIIGLYAKTELSFDNFHKNKQNVYRLLSTTETGKNSANVTYRLGPDCAQNISGVTQFARLYNFWGPNSIKHNSDIFKADNLFFTDPGILDIFSFSFVEGNKNLAFDKPGSIIITKSISDNYFGESPSLGETVILDNNESLTVTGVVEDFPLNSHIKFDFLVYEPRRLGGWGDWVNTSWNFPNFNTYLLFQENYTEEQFYKEFNGFAQKAVDGENMEYIQNTKIQNLSDIHLHSKNVENDFGSKGNYESIVILISLAFCIMLIGIINYISLCASNVSARIKEVGIRKVCGANKTNIAINYIGESIILSVLALVFAFLIVKFIYLNLGSYVYLNFGDSDLTNPLFIFLSLAIAVVIALITGVYVSKNIMKYKPVRLLRGRQHLSKITGFSKSYLFLSVQFSVSIVLIASTVIIFKQLNFIQTKDLGYKADMVLSIPIDKTQNTKEILKETLLAYPQIKDIALTSSFPPNGYHNGNVNELEGEEHNEFSAKNFFVDYNFIEFMNMEIVEGRNFLKGSKSDEKEGAIVNQAFVKKMGWKSAIGKRIKNQYNQDELTIIGVVKDFHFKTLHELIEPVLITIGTPEDLYKMGVKFNGNITAADIDFIKSEWKKINPGNLFEYELLDDIVNQSYSQDKKQARIIMLFALLAIAITCMGLVAISVFQAKQLTKEIGIRKVNGARVLEIITMINMDFVKWICIAFVIATPVAWLAMNRWLQSFAYKTSLSWWVFVFAGALAMGIALLAVSFQSWKAATRNPVEALRYE